MLVSSKIAGPAGILAVILIGLSGPPAAAQARDPASSEDPPRAPLSAAPSADFDARPRFALPFRCEEFWALTTYHGHDPDDRKVDFFNAQGETEGVQVVASAPGVVTRLVEHGGVKIDHGHGWYTIALHMQDISVRAGEAVEAGAAIGRIGRTDTDIPHLHYEQLFDGNSDGVTDHLDIVVPAFEGRSYRLDPDSDSPVLQSRNGCD